MSKLSNKELFALLMKYKKAVEEENVDDLEICSGYLEKVLSGEPAIERRLDQTRYRIFGELEQVHLSAVGTVRKLRDEAKDRLDNHGKFKKQENAYVMTQLRSGGE
ncbi:hypothetical protein [Vibrio mediterranei]|uniref:hypothetical protein n=1 Tax=Vibrio mediterranei TaxID=689 RepID=UPI004067864C